MVPRTFRYNLSVPKRLASILIGIAIACRMTTCLAAQPRELRWAGDSEGGAPFVEADPSHPDIVVGFDVDVAALMARSLGRFPRFVMITFAAIDQSIVRGDAD